MRIDKAFTPTVLAIFQFEIGKDAFLLEQALHKEYDEYRYYGDPVMKNGNSELFVKDILGYDY